MLRYFLLSMVILAVTAKPHRKPGWHGHGQNNHGHGSNHGHGNSHNNSNTQSQTVSGYRFINGDECGTQAIKPIIPFIVGGTQAVPHSWPWMVSLYYNGYHRCGGSLISNQYVLTAAHCIEGTYTSRWLVRLGKHDLYNNNEHSQVEVTLESMGMHGSYNRRTFSNDIAIMKLNHPVTFTNEINPVCVAEKLVDHGRNCITTGWGNTQDSSQPSNILNQVNVPIIGPNTCSSSDYYGSDYDSSTMVCAGYDNGGKDSCQGDSGGPLVHFENNKWYLTGITSWGYGCAVAKKPGVYARADVYAQWIDDAIKSLE